MLFVGYDAMKLGGTLSINLSIIITQINIVFFCTLFTSFNNKSCFNMSID